MKKLFFVCSLIYFCFFGAMIHSSSEQDRQVLLQESILQLNDALVLWKEEAKTDSQLSALLDQIIYRLKDSDTPNTIKALYGILLVKVHAVSDFQEQKVMLHHILSQSSHELMQEVAAMIQLLRDE
jgi:hypothetical protein